LQKLDQHSRFFFRLAPDFRSLEPVSSPIEQRLAAALAECEQLRAENQQLREHLGLPQAEAAAQSTDDTIEFKSILAKVTSKSSSDEKVKLFRSLFRGRDDVYAAR